MSEHPIIHIELSAKDRSEAMKFYSELFEWKMNVMPEMDYATFDAGIGGGINPITESYPAGTVTFYVYTSDIEATLAQVEKLGGKTLVPKSPIPGVGNYGLFIDPTGNMIGLLDTPPE